MVPSRQTTERERPQKGEREYHINRIEYLQHDKMLDKIVKQFWETNRWQASKKL